MKRSLIVTLGVPTAVLLFVLLMVNVSSSYHDTRDLGNGFIAMEISTQKSVALSIAQDPALILPCLLGLLAMVAGTHFAQRTATGSGMMKSILAIVAGAVLLTSALLVPAGDLKPHTHTDIPVEIWNAAPGKNSEQKVRSLRKDGIDADRFARKANECYDYITGQWYYAKNPVRK
jgi:hypothetical protein